MIRLRRRPVDLDLVERILIVNLRPGDIVVLQVDRDLPLEALEFNSNLLQAKFPENRVCVLAGGAKLSVIRPDGATQDVTP